MLLEQHKDAVLHLLSDSKQLEEQVNIALKTLKEYVYCWLWGILGFALLSLCTSFMSLHFWPSLKLLSQIEVQINIRKY